MRRPLWCRAFLAALNARAGKVAPAARDVGVSRQQVYRRRRVDPSFALDMDRALATFESSLEESCSADS